jgi:hypothetical protein
MKKHRDWVYYHRRKDTFYFKNVNGSVMKITPKDENQLTAFKAMVIEGYGSTVDIKPKNSN